MAKLHILKVAHSVSKLELMGRQKILQGLMVTGEVALKAI